MTRTLLAFTVLALATLSLDAQAQQRPQGNKPPQNVIVARATFKDFVDRVEALGTLRANETVALTASITEKVVAVNFEDNKRVTQGDVLVEMAGGEEKANLDAERATLAEARRQLARAQPLVASGAASQAELDTRKRDLQTAQARLSAVQSRIGDRVITAPFDGVVGLRNISVGALLQPGTQITTLDDDSVMKLDFTVPSLFLETLKPGLEIIATTRAFEGREFKGEITGIESRIDPITRAITVRAVLPNDDRVLRPGLLMGVEILKNPRKAIVVPEEAIVPQARRNFVFVIANDTAARREVTTGARRLGEVEILSGLKDGDMVVTHGTMTLSDGAPVKITATDTGDKPMGELLQKKDTKAAKQEGK